MKKVSLLLGFAILLGFGGMAQETAAGSLTPAQVKNQRVQLSQTVNAEAPVQAAQESKALQSGYYMQSFEGSFLPTGWTKQTPFSTMGGWSQATVGTSPLYYMGEGTQTAPPMGGSKVAFCNYMTGIPSGGNGKYDQWLISPQFSVVADDSLKFYIFRYGLFMDSMQVLLSTTGNDRPSFTTVLLDLDTAQTPDMGWKQFSVDLTPYAGQNVYIAFREHVLDDDTNEVVGGYYALDRVFLGNVGALTDVATATLDMNSKVIQSVYTPSASFYNEGATSQTFDVTLEISPDGYTSTKTVTDLLGGQSQQISFDAWDASALTGVHSFKVYTSLAGDENALNDTLKKQITVVAFQNKAYAYVVYDFTKPMVPLETAIIDLANKNNVWILNDSYDPYGGDHAMGGAWANKHWYVTTSLNNFSSIDTLTGDITTIGPLGMTIYDIAYDKDGGIMYGITGAELYTVDMATGATTFVNDLGQNGFNTLACKDGVLYATNQAVDKLFSIDKATGATAEIGSLDFNTTVYSQGLDFGPDGKLVMTAYTSPDSIGELRIIDVTSGYSTELGLYGDGQNQIAGLAIPGDSWSAGLSVNDANVAEINVDVYPNPAKNTASLVSAEKIKSYKVMTVSGQVIKSEKVNAGIVSLDIANLENGLYIVQIETAKGMTTRKVNVCR